MSEAPATLRLEKAKQLLETTTVAINAVANQVGYEDTRSFRRLFRRRVGLTPLPTAYASARSGRRWPKRKIAAACTEIMTPTSHRNAASQCAPLARPESGQRRRYGQFCDKAAWVLSITLSPCGLPKPSSDEGLITSFEGDGRG